MGQLIKGFLRRLLWDVCPGHACQRCALCDRNQLWMPPLLQCCLCLQTAVMEELLDKKMTEVLAGTRDVPLCVRGHMACAT